MNRKKKKTEYCFSNSLFFRVNLKKSNSKKTNKSSSQHYKPKRPEDSKSLYKRKKKRGRLPRLTSSKNLTSFEIKDEMNGSLYKHFKGPSDTKKKNRKFRIRSSNSSNILRRAYQKLNRSGSSAEHLLYQTFLKSNSNTNDRGPLSLLNQTHSVSRPRKPLKEEKAVQKPSKTVSKTAQLSQSGSGTTNFSFHTNSLLTLPKIEESLPLDRNLSNQNEGLKICVNSEILKNRSVARNPSSQR